MPPAPELAVEVGLDLGRRLAERGVLVRRHAFDPELRSGRPCVMLPTVMLRGAQRLAQPLHLRLGLEPQRIVGLDAQHEVHAALQVEPELQRLVDQPRRAPVMP